MKLSVIDLFAGIGGFSLGLERTGGFETVAVCELDPFCRKVLAKHWPQVRQHPDVTTYDFKQGEADVITAGFPCQDVSNAGLGAGLTGARSGLYREVIRAVRLVRPLYAILENVAALLGRGLGTVLGDLAEVGYDAEWHCIPAADVGAPHERDRIWIIAHADQNGLQERMHVAGVGGEASSREQSWRSPHGVPSSPEPANTYARQFALGRASGRVGRIVKPFPRHRPWAIASEPVLGRGADGIPDRLDRVGALGNAVVPQIPELIGNAILASLKEDAA